MRKSETGKPQNTILSLYRDYGVIPKDSRDDNYNRTSENTDTYRVVDVDDLVVNKMKAWQGSLAVSQYSGIVSPAYYVYKITDASVFPRYLHYACRNPSYIPEYKRLSGGIRPDQWDLSSEAFSQTLFLLPPFEEQMHIARYLDERTTEIDSLIEKTEKSIELLEEYRKSVISEVVTKGLNPDVSMKDSGIEWIGKIPEHWKCQKIKYCLTRIFDIDHYMPEGVDDGFPYLMIADLAETSSAINWTQTKKISANEYVELSKKGRPEKGDIIIARYATIGTTCLVDTENEFLVTYACLTLTPNTRIVTAPFLARYLQSSSFSEEITRQTNSNTQGNVGKESLQRAYIVLPPVEEQVQIVNYLESSIKTIDGLIIESRRLINALSAFRKSLIFEAVAGKFKVPGVV